MKTSRRQRGFTLLEIMIALTIFAVISTLAWQILDGAMRTSSATDTRATRRICFYRMAMPWSSPR